MRTWTIGAIGGLGCVVALGCGSNEPAKSVESSESRAVRALIDSMRFDGGVAYLQPIPPTTEGTVNLLGDAFDLLEPGVAGLLPFTEDNPLADDDSSSAVLIGFGDEDRHISVPVDKSVGDAGELSFAYELDEDVCEGLCNRRYTIQLRAAIELESGGIGELLESEIVLDCRAHGSEEMCAPGEHSQTPPTMRDMDASTNEQPDAGEQDAAGEDDAGNDAGETPSSGLIGEAGGTVSLPDGAEAVIPAMAVDEPTPIALKVASQTPALPSDVEGAGDAYVFEPHGTVFDEPVTLRLPFTGSATDCRVLYLDDEDDETWEAAEATPMIEGGIAELEVTHFSIYQVVRPAAVSVDPCVEDNGGCDTSPMATCEPDGSARTCACPSGYEGDGVGTDGCTDALECATDNGGCAGSHECIEQVGDDPLCDLDECATDNGDCGDATYTACENQLDGAAPVCTDIDECATDNGGCGADTCADNIGAAPTCGDCATTMSCPVGAMTQLVAGSDHVCALYELGEVFCWGGSSAEQLGRGAGSASAPPGRVLLFNGLVLDDAVAISANSRGNHTCALRENGTVACWGDSASGQCGSDAPSSALRAYVVPDIANAISISAGTSHSCAVLTGGAARCWGNNASGQLAAGVTVPAQSAPALVAVEVDPINGGQRPIADAEEVIAGQNHTCFVHAGRTQVSCAGSNSTGGGHIGMLGRGGIGGIYPILAPATLPLGTNVQSIHIGSGFYASHTCVLTTNTRPLCWGTNTYEQLTTSVGAVSVPTQLDPYYSMAQSIALGSDFTCVSYVHSTLGPRVACQGTNGSGQLGDSAAGATSDAVPDDVGAAMDRSAFLDGSQVEMMAAGRAFMCIKLVGSGVTCWGANGNNVFGGAGAGRSFADVSALVPGLP